MPLQTNHLLKPSNIYILEIFKQYTSRINKFREVDRHLNLFEKARCLQRTLCLRQTAWRREGKSQQLRSSVVKPSRLKSSTLPLHRSTRWTPLSQSQVPAFTKEPQAPSFLGEREPVIAE